MIECRVGAIQWFVNVCFEVYLKEKQKTQNQKNQITTDSTPRGVRLFDFKKIAVTVGYFEKNNAYLEAGWGR